LSVEWKWDKRAVQRELARLVSKLGPETDRRVAGVKCPDHPEHQFLTESKDGEVHLMWCCPKGLGLAAEAAGLELEWKEP
jgi:hypothetical protein